MAMPRKAAAKQTTFGADLIEGMKLVLALVAALATVAPTARALRVDPAVALRHE